MEGLEVGKQGKETLILWEFDKFTSIQRDAIETYYIRYATLINKLARNEFDKRSIETNIKLLNHLQSKCRRFISIVKQISMNNFDYFKQNQQEVNEIHAKMQGKTQDPLALVERTFTPYPYAQTQGYLPQQPYALQSFSPQQPFATQQSSVVKYAP
ncbi:hypothetical protein Tco_1248072, partial [Tanacetum coccineum]